MLMTNIYAPQIKICTRMLMLENLLLICFVAFILSNSHADCIINGVSAIMQIARFSFHNFSVHPAKHDKGINFCFSYNVLTSLHLWQAKYCTQLPFEERKLCLGNSFSSLFSENSYLPPKASGSVVIFVKAPRKLLAFKIQLTYISLFGQVFFY